MAEKKEDPIEILGDYDLADALSIELVESGLLDPESRQALCDPEKRQKLIPAIIETIKREISGSESRIDSVSTAVETKASNVFCVPVVYVQPEMQELMCRFTVWLSPDFRGKDFVPIDRCKDVSMKSREVVFQYVHMGRDAWNNETLAEMDRRGLRPALYEELLCFAREFPEEQGKHPIIALGSVTFSSNFSCVAFLDNAIHKLCLRIGWDIGWGKDCRFLATEKAA